MNVTATLFGQMGTFLVLVLFVMKFLWKPILDALEDRRTRIAEGLAAASYEEAGVVAVNVEDGAAHVLAEGVPEVHGHVSAGEGHDVLEDLGCDGDDIGGLFEYGDADLCGLCADAENAGLAVANDVDFDVLALDV